MAPRTKRVKEFETNSSGLPKITRPLLENIYLRTRLFSQLDEARKRPIIWISAPAGSGKTTLVASYLQAQELAGLWYQVDAGDNDIASFFYYMGLAAKLIAPQYREPLPVLSPEYVAGLSKFTINYFRELFGRLKRPGILVLDNFQDATSADVLQEVLRDGFLEIPCGFNVIVLSREDPPSTLARLRASERITVLNWSDLKLTEEESHGVARLRQIHSRLTHEMLQRLHQDTQGWVAGLVLASEQMEINGPMVQHPSESTQQWIFDYFASEIFSRAGIPLQTFLLKTAFIPTISINVATRLTAERNCAAMLENLRCRNYFTVRHGDGSYEYHPLFRDFLRHRARAFYTEEQIKDLQRSSALGLAESGNFEAAISLLQDAQDWPEALRLILEKAPALAAQGRVQTLEIWLQQFPETYRNENPWVLYWLGTCRLAFCPTEARQFLEQAFVLFERQTDASPLYLTWSGIIESFAIHIGDFTTIGKWLDLYPSLEINRSAPTPAIKAATVFNYMVGLLFARYTDPDLHRYAARAETLFTAETDPNLQLKQGVNLCLYNFSVGNFYQVDRLLTILAPHANSPKTKPLGRLNWYTWKVKYASVTGATDEVFAALTDGLALAEQSGIHVRDVHMLSYSILCQLDVGDVKAARNSLDKLSVAMHCAPYGNTPGAYFYSSFVSLVLLHEENIPRAQEEATHSLQLARNTGRPLCIVSALQTLASVFLRQGVFSQACDLLTEARALCLSNHNPPLLVLYCAFTEANMHRLRGERQPAERVLSEALHTGKEMGATTPPFCLRDDVAMLYAMALEANIAPDYVRTLIKKTRLTPPKNMVSESWPWPIRIYTMGKFAVVRDDEPMDFLSGVKKKPWVKPRSLLRALLALGARDVSVTHLAEMLWPDSEGDMAKLVLNTTLHRLRKLLGENSVVLQHGMLSLRPESCWVDIWALERVCAAEYRNVSPATRAEAIFALYQGEFLEDEELPAALLRRKSVHSKFLRAMVEIGDQIESQNDWNTAIGLYQRVIEVDPLSEEFHGRLMQAYRRLNRSTEALGIYDNYVAMLRAVRHSEPTAALKNLFENIQRELV